MDKRTKILARARLREFAVEAYRSKKFIKCRLMQMEHCTRDTVPNGFKVIPVDGKPFIGRA